MKSFVDIDFAVTDITSAVHITNNEKEVHIQKNNCNKIIYVISGSFECNLSSIIDNECLLFVPEGYDLSITIKQPLNAYIINFKNSDKIDIEPVFYKVKSSVSFENLFRLIYIERTNEGLYCMTKCKKWLYEIIFRIKQDCREMYVPNHKAIRLKPAFDYISANFLTENINTAALAKLCNMSESHFRDIFKQTTGYTPKHYINSVKINYAAELILKRNYKNINDISTASGFNDLSYFSRIFLKIFGIRPSTYIKAAHEQEK